MIHLYRGFHHPLLVDVLKAAWEKQELVILVPQNLQDFSFLRKISREDTQYHGDWSDEQKQMHQDLFGVETHPLLKKARIGVFTSGTSTGLSRLVFYSQENIESSLKSIRELFDVTRIQKIFAYPQPTHTFGLLLGYMQAIIYNVEIHFSPGAYNREAHLHWLKTADEKTLTLGAPAHFVDLIQHCQTQNIKAPRTYASILGGARVSTDLWHKLQTVLQVEAPSIGYGATEASPGVTHLPPGVRPSEDGDIGYALSGVQVSVTDRGLSFSGKNVCYLIFENQTFKEQKEILLRDAIVTSRTEQGPRFTYLGRTDGLINRGGIKISLEVLESKLAEHFSVKALAVSLYDSRLGDDVAVVIQTDQKINPSDIQNYIKSEWKFVIPDHSILLAPIPLNANGKGDRTEALKLILKQKSWTFPVSIQHLRNLLPHKGPAMWLDEILEVKPRFGIVRVKLQEDKNYFSLSEGQLFLRQTACIEWVAQSYGYVVALNDILGIQKADAATRTYIAEVKSAEFSPAIAQKDFKPGDEIEIRVQCTHDFGKLKVVEGHALHNQEVIAVLNLKLFCG